MNAHLKSRKSAIYSALLKYGYSNFKLEILEYCKASDAIAREQLYITSLRPEYNILKLAGYRFGANTLNKPKTNLEL
jgi:group I intron endonuclease